MSSNLFARRQLGGIAAGQQSIYETIREHEEAHSQAADEDHSVDERNFGERFNDQDIEGLLAEAAESQTTTESTAFLQQQDRSNRSQKQKWTDEGSEDAHGEDVPASLFLDEEPYKDEPESSRRQDDLPPPVPGPAFRASKVQWGPQNGPKPAARAPKRDIAASITASSYFSATAAEKAMWRWTNVENLDNFLTEVYTYYVQKGIWSITLTRVLRSLQLGFIVTIVIFLTYCVDYSLVPLSKSLSEVVIPQCTKRMSFFPTLFLWLFIGHWLLTMADTVLDLRRLRQLHDFYVHLLGISEEELQTISWQEVVGRLMSLRDANPRTALKISARAARFVGDNSKDRMDAHDIANRIMRKENYLIALFNKDILNMSLPIPFLGNRQLYSRNLEWNINHAILGFFFNEKGQVYQYFLKDTDRKRLIDTLRRRFVFYGCMNLLQAPFLVTYSLTTYFFRYFKEFQSNPSQLGSRAYTPMAEWKFREFNELYHFFRRRADMSVPFASRYLDQFPKDKTVQISGFIAFVSGALLALLAMASLLDPSNFLNFEISSERTVLFYLGVLTIIWTVSKGIVPEENEVFDPEFAVQEVINYTHFCPASWKGRLHSDHVRKEFSSLYQMRILIFLEEVMSIIVTPLVLWFSLPNCSDRIVDFFREFTVHVDGLGYVCSFALFEFKRGERAIPGTREPVVKPDEHLREEYYSSNDNKMLASYYSFIDNYGNNTNRRAARPHKTRFNPPPAFPGLASTPAFPSSSMRHTTASLRNDPARSMHRSVAVMEPTQSLLLDPQHQPSPSVARRLNKSAAALARSRHDASFPSEQSLSSSPSRQRQSRYVPHLGQPVTTTTILEEDSRLGDSWKVSRAANVDDDDSEREEFDSGDDVGGGGAGVLGLLYQFQKAQTGKGAAGGI